MLRDGDAALRDHLDEKRGLAKSQTCLELQEDNVSDDTYLDSFLPTCAITLFMQSIPSASVMLGFQYLSNTAGAI